MNGWSGGCCRQSDWVGRTERLIRMVRWYARRMNFAFNGIVTNFTKTGILWGAEKVYVYMRDGGERMCCAEREGENNLVWPIMFALLLPANSMTSGYRRVTWCSCYRWMDMRLTRVGTLPFLAILVLFVLHFLLLAICMGMVIEWNYLCYN